MKALILSDIHGNYDALEAVLAEACTIPWKELWFLGDLGGYGPETEKCFQLIKTYKTVLIPGNHDLYYAGRLKRSQFSREALQALVISGASVSKEFIETMKSIPLRQTRKGISLVHGSFINPEIDYIIQESDAVKNFKILKGKCGLFGHTHRQGCFLQEDNEVSWIKPEEGKAVDFRKKRILINPGSIGQPRDHDPRSAWAIVDTSKQEVRFYRTKYDILSVQNKMKALGSSEFLIERLEKGM